MKITIRHLSASTRRFLELESVQKKLFLDGDSADFRWIQADGSIWRGWAWFGLVSRISRALAILLDFLPRRRNLDVPVFLRRAPEPISSQLNMPFLSLFSAVNRTILFHGVPETFSTVATKTFLDLKLALESEFDYLVRTNSSTFLNVNAIRGVLLRSPSKRLYAGPVQQLLGLTYVSGSLIIMSRDVVEGIVANEDKFHFEHMDDVAIGLLIQKTGIAIPEHLERFEYPFLGKAVELNSRQLTYPAYRCKSPSLEIQIARLTYLHEALGSDMGP